MPDTHQVDSQTQTSGAGTSTDLPKPQPWESWTGTELNAIDNVVKNARPDEVTNAFARLMPNFPRSTWLEDGHLLGNGTKVVKKPPYAEDVSTAIAEYAAASVPLHASDAWTYFGRAMHAIASGSIEVAQHLLYYSELRAMHALLFRHGVVLLRALFIRSDSGVSFRGIGFPFGRIEVPKLAIFGTGSRCGTTLLQAWMRSN
ncbi:hypothetical protein [Rathayibacter tritici]|uniref:hypothetical protein n=1 Tax=Rathayibacter tritici TaxID=33888 RepID=UPI0012FCC42D|nr:hypothetical protein [Rathayibacter tritici]